MIGTQSNNTKFKSKIKKKCSKQKAFKYDCAIYIKITEFFT